MMIYHSRYFLKLLCTLSFLILSLSSSMGQKKCATPVYQHISESPQQFENWIKNKIDLKKTNILPQGRSNQEQATLYTIPVVFHIVHNGESLGSGGNIPDGQIFSQMDILNEDFRRLNADTVNTPPEFRPVAADIEVEFVLARRDPLGQATSGINRIQGIKAEWNAFSPIDDEQLKSTIYWPAEDYINIWVTALQSNVLGYASFPESSLPGIDNPETNRLLDGAVIDYNFFGEGFNAFTFSKGRTATHEIGHFLGLKHMDGDPELGVDGCTVDDFVDDTPNVEDQASGCPTGIVTCSSTDMIQNYMDFSDDECMNIFTEQQKDRMRVVLDNSPRRLSLLTSAGLIPPILGFDLGISEINNPSLINCEESLFPSITITNFGTQPVSSFDLSYQLNGGTLVSATHSDSTLESTESVTLTFPEIIIPEGPSDFRAVISNVAEGDENPTNDEINEIRFLEIREDIIPLREEFIESEFQNGWFVINFDNNLTWEIEEAGNPGFAAGVNHFNNAFIGEENWLVSPILDFSSTTEASLFFDVSYAVNLNRNDILRVLVSTDCGANFNNLVYEKSGAELSTNEGTSSWAPAGPEDYRKEEVDLNQFVGMPEVRVAFIAVNDFGNNLYLDNIEFYTTSLDKIVETQRNSIKIYPNPTSDEFNMVINLKERETITVEIMDATGRIIYTEDFNNTLNQTFSYDMETFPAGLYLIRAAGRTIDRTERLIKFR